MELSNLKKIEEELLRLKMIPERLRGELKDYDVYKSDSGYISMSLTLENEDILFLTGINRNTRKETPSCIGIMETREFMLQEFQKKRTFVREMYHIIYDIGYKKINGMDYKISSQNQIKTAINAATELVDELKEMIEE